MWLVKIFRPVPCLLGSCYLFVAQLSRVEALRNRSFATLGDWITAILVTIFTGLFSWCIWASLKWVRRTTKVAVVQPDALAHALQTIGCLFPPKLREEIYDNSVSDLLSDWIEARRSGRSPTLLQFVFVCRAMGIFVITILVGLERLLRKLPMLVVFFKLFGK